MAKKQKDYPDECPVFQWQGLDGQVVEIGDVNEPGWRTYPIRLNNGDGLDPNDTWPLKVSELRPLTPAAEDLLAAIKAELGQ